MVTKASAASRRYPPVGIAPVKGMAIRTAEQQNPNAQPAKDHTKRMTGDAPPSLRSSPTSGPMTIREFKVLQANLHKKREAQLSLMNDDTLANFSLLLISEPYTFSKDDSAPAAAPLHHPYWTPILPSTWNDRWPAIRSMIWA